MKNMILALVAILLGAVSATAQNHISYVVYDGVTDGINATSTNSAPATLQVGDYRVVSALLSYSLPAGTNGAVTMELVRSPDGTHWEITPVATLTLTSTGTSVTNGMTNIDVGAAHSIQIKRIINANTNNITNLIVVLSAKK